MNAAFSLTQKQQWIVGSLLLLIMLATRSHIWMSHIQDASWAIFFLVGFYLRKTYALPVFLLVAYVIDLIVIDAKGGESFCYTPAYFAIFPAYTALWFAGRWFSAHYSEDLRGLLYLLASAVIGIIVCDIISSGAFYWFSGHFTEPRIATFLQRLATYMPWFMKNTLFYLAIASVIHLGIAHTHRIKDGAHQA